MSLLTNPLFAVGTGLLASSRTANPWAGITHGLLAAQRGQEGELMNQYRQQQMEVLRQQQAEAARKQEEQAAQRERMAAAIAGLPPELQAAAAARPEILDQYYENQMTPAKPSITLFREDGGEVMVTPQQAAELLQSGGYSTQAPTSPPDIARRAVEAGFAPGSPEYQAFIRDATMKPGTTVNVGTEPTYKVPANYMPADPNDPAAGVVPIPGGPATELSEGQGLATGYRDRMQAAETVLTALESTGYDPANIRDQFLHNVVKSPQGQQYRQAQEDWVRSKLRKESGAVIGDEEMDREIKVYFPQVGDSAEVRKQKAEARQRAIQAMGTAASGKGAGEAPQSSKKTVKWADL